jgi:hypothetical protein
MKYFMPFAGLFVILLSTSCEKDRRMIGCTAQYIAPTLRFQVIDKNDGTDLFFAAAPKFSTSDIKVHFKNSQNKLDSLAPQVETVNNNKVFVYAQQRANLNDTCYLKIKGLKTDTLIYSIKLTEPCSRPVINKVSINGSVSNLADGAILQVKK